MVDSTASRPGRITGIGIKAVRGRQFGREPDRLRRGRGRLVAIDAESLTVPEQCGDDLDARHGTLAERKRRHRAAAGGQVRSVGGRHSGASARVVRASPPSGSGDDRPWSARAEVEPDLAGLEGAVIYQGTAPSPATSANIAIAPNEVARLSVLNVTITHA